MLEHPLLFVAALAVLGGMGCTDHGVPTSSVDDTTFIRTMVDLQRASDDTLLDSLMLDSVRHMILRRHNLSADRLVEAARAMAYDPGRAMKIWKAIDSGRYNLGAAAPLSHEGPVPAGHATTPSGPPR
jgi:hypothetical protein